MTATSLLLKNVTTEALASWLETRGGNAFSARKIQMAAVRDGCLELPEQIREVRKSLLSSIRSEMKIPHLRLLERRVSSVDQFAKYLFESHDGARFEAVRIPLLHVAGDEKYVVCVSSQVGCAMGCVFCATARLGFKRNLAPWEIVDQVVQIRRDSSYPVRGIVFMGMGEPMMNYDAVVTAAKIFSDPCGMAIDGKAITISTVGIPEGIRRLAAERRPWRLVVSLGSADPATRRRLFPIDATYSLETLGDAVLEYHRLTGKRVTLAWPMIAGETTTVEAATHLARWVGEMPALLNLIPINDPSGQRQTPSEDELDAFLGELRQRTRLPVVRRYSGGQDIDGACGMLVARYGEAL